jgi:UDP-GlcNAc3NAcA epimerase
MPEEINRSLNDRISNFLFCPTQLSVDNLKAEGITNNVILSGDVMQDSAIFYANKSEEKSTIINKLKLKEDFILCTIHRQENTDNIEAMRNIINSLINISKSIRVLCPLHPRTKKIISELNITPQFEIIDPVGYFDMLELLKNCTLVVTDSGGLQKEAYFFKKQCVTLREETEWVELVENGFNKLVGSDSELIEKEVTNSLNSQVQFGIELYGGGNASTTIANFLSELNA